MWVLIFGIIFSPMADNEFASVSNQEFTSEAACKKAATEFSQTFSTFKSADAKAFCVQK